MWHCNELSDVVLYTNVPVMSHLFLYYKHETSSTYAVCSVHLNVGAMNIGISNELLAYGLVSVNYLNNIFIN